MKKVFSPSKQFVVGKGGNIVTNTLGQRISTMRRGAASAALALVTVLGLGVATAHRARAQTFTVLYNFTGSSDGGNPYAGVVRDAAGNLYGTTYYYGGTSSQGVVFKVDTSGTESVLHSFTGSWDGGNPFGGVVRDAAGNLYGTTVGGGTYNWGTVFKVSKSGKETTLHSFANGKDGCEPDGGLLRDKAGNLYGTTTRCGTFSMGTVFKVSKTGKETVLHSFAGTDGAWPMFTSLVMDKKGNLYGTTLYGGATGSGTVYKLSKGGALTVLHSFTGKTTDGCFPAGTPAMDEKGNLYGAANGCGSAGLGIVWEVSSKGTETVLHNFTGGETDGAYPTAGVIIDAKGNLYGDTEYGGASGFGAVYELNPKGALTLLHSLAASDGEYPWDNLIRDAKGNLYGTAYGGGSDGYGTVWKLTP